MRSYLVKATPKPGRLLRLRRRLQGGEVLLMHPFGEGLDFSLKNARRGPDGTALWEVDDDSSPPMTQQRRAILNEYFRDLEAVEVKKGEGWRRIDDLPSLWLRDL